jgi:hypothetical protein
MTTPETPNASRLCPPFEAGLADTDEDSAVREAIQRDEELSSGSAAGRTHEKVMLAARRFIARRSSSGSELV